MIQKINSMKIIERGISKVNSYRHRCNSCNTLFEYNDDDIKHDQRDGNYVICPMKGCGKFISTDKSNFEGYNDKFQNKRNLLEVINKE